MGNIKLPTMLTPAVIQAVTNNVKRCFESWVASERSRTSPKELADLQAAYDRANATYQEALDRAAREGVPDAPS
jgi:hypothetical protein